MASLISRIGNRILGRPAQPPALLKPPGGRRCGSGLGLALGASLFLHAAPLVITPLLHSPAETESQRIELILSDLEKPGIEENRFSEEESEQFKAGLKEAAGKGKEILAGGSSDRGEFFISFEYYAQHLQKNSYLMPLNPLNDLLAIYREDREKFRAVAGDRKLSREEKLKRLKEITYSRSVYDPRAKVLTSLLVPEGGQECKTRFRYQWSIARHFKDELLYPGERFVLAEHDDHQELGIFNSQTNRAILPDKKGYQPQSSWGTVLYDPLLAVERRIAWYEKRKADNRKFLVREPNEKLKKPVPITVAGPAAPLDFTPPENADYPANPFYDKPVTLRRRKAGPQILSRRRSKVLRWIEKRGFWKIKPAVSEAAPPEPIELTLFPELAAEEFNALKSLAEKNHLPLDFVIDRAVIKKGKLQGLDLSGTRITDLSPLARLKSLQVLYLSGTRITDLSPLAGLKSLQWLLTCAS